MNYQNFRPGEQFSEQGQAVGRLSRLADLLENLQDAIIITDSQEQITYWNHAAELLYGWSEADVLGKNILDVVQAQYDSQLRKKLTEELENRDFVSFEVEHRTRDGAAIFLECKILSVRAADGKLTSSIRIIHDVTQKTRAERTLLENEQYWRTIVDFTYDWEYWIDTAGRIIFSSPSCLRITGYTGEDFRRDPELLLKVVHPDDRERVERHIQTEQDSSNAASLDYRILTPSGEVRWLGHICQPVYSSEGKPRGRRVSNRDITLDKKAEETLHYHAILLDHLSDAVVASDENYRLTAWNQAAERLYGWKAEEVLGKSGLEIIKTEFSEGDKARMLATIAAGGLYEGEATQARRDGTRFPVDVRSIVLRDNHGKITGYLSLNRDITVQKRDQARLLSGLARIEVQRRLLEQREQERQQISRDLHDGPIQELAGLLFSLHELVLDYSDPTLVDKLNRVAASIQEQIRELRTYAGELRPPAISNFGLGKAIRSHITAYQEKHHELKLHFYEDQEGELLPLDVRLALFRIYQESLTNITKHAQASSINVRLIKTNEEALLEIQDDGHGFDIPADWLSLARQGHLGLVGMSERAEAIGGTLKVFSAPGEGVLIRVIVPLTKKNQEDSPLPDGFPETESPHDSAA